MEEINKKILEDHTKALNRVADVMGDFIEGLPGFVKQLTRNEALLMAQHERVKTRDQIEQDILNYERKKEANEKKKKKKATTTNTKRN